MTQAGGINSTGAAGGGGAGSGGGGGGGSSFIVNGATGVSFSLVLGSPQVGITFNGGSGSCTPAPVAVVAQARTTG